MVHAALKPRFCPNRIPAYRKLIEELPKVSVTNLAPSIFKTYTLDR